MNLYSGAQLENDLTQVYIANNSLVHHLQFDTKPCQNILISWLGFHTDFICDTENKKVSWVLPRSFHSNQSTHLCVDKMC